MIFAYKERDFGKVLRVVKKIYINASIDIFNQDTKLVDVDGLRSSLTPLSKLCVQIKSETLLKSWKPFYFLKESIPYPG